MTAAMLADLVWVQQLISSFITVALLFVSYEYHRRYRLSKVSHSKASQQVYNDLRILFLLIGAAFAFSSGGQGEDLGIWINFIGSGFQLAAAIWAARVALSRFLPRDR
jgi:hypothetical protein